MPLKSVFRPGLFKGKVAIVTGGATGIGNAITKELLHLGCSVMMASRKAERLSAAEAELRRDFAPATVAAAQCNIRREEEVSALFAATLARFGRVDFLVNNGGGQFPSPAKDLSLKGWNAVVETNLTGTFLMCREAHKTWMGEHGGTIVTIVTDMWKGWPMMAHSGAARAAVDNLTKSLAVEWTSSGVRVNAVAPGSTIYSSTAAGNYQEEGFFEKRRHMVPAKRLGKPEEVSAAVLYLLSPAAAYVTGETLRIDGGASLYGQLFWTVPEHDKSKAFTWDEEEEGGKAKL